MSKFGRTDLKLSPFVPYLGFWTGHSQTILGHIIPSAELEIYFHTETLTLPDGDQLLVEYHQGSEPYTLSIYHGLGGHSRSDYMRRSAILAKDLGWNIVLVNHRAVSDQVVAEKSYHSGRGEDAEFVVQWCRNKFPGSKQIALGFSMSGSILLNLLTERYGTKQPDVAIVVNAPLDLKSASVRLTKGLSRLYDLRFFLILKKTISKKNDVQFPFVGRTMDIDRLYTAPANQFLDRDDYYEKCSTKKYLSCIKTKTFVLAAKDDPFIDIQDYINGAWSESVHLTMNEWGGHMGYYSKSEDPKYGRRWLDHYLMRVFETLLQDKII